MLQPSEFAETIRKALQERDSIILVLQGERDRLKTRLEQSRNETAGYKRLYEHEQMRANGLLVELQLLKGKIEEILGEK
jgi:predicted ribosome quality control (RQC) complex YloA/Tae2 family protein